MTPPAIFDRSARRLRRDRIAGRPAGPAELHVAELLDERLDAVTRNFGNALVINCGDGATSDMLRARGISVSITDIGARFATKNGGILCDEDQLPVEPGSFDLVVAPWGLDTVDDLPGALILARRALHPDGLFLGVLAAAPSLPVLRKVIAAAEANAPQSIARIHPQIEVRAAGDLLVRTGFSLPVADLETVRLAYRDVLALFRDLREAAATNLLAKRYAVSRSWLEQVAAGFAGEADADGRTIETVTLAVLTGWAPASTQPRPAKRGSGTVSLARALRR